MSSPDCPICKQNYKIDKIKNKFHSIYKMRRAYIRVGKNEIRRFEAVGYYCLRHNFFLSDDFVSQFKNNYQKIFTTVANFSETKLNKLLSEIEKENNKKKF